MANIALNGIAAAYSGTYASRMLLEPMFAGDDIMRNYTIYPNVKYKQNILMAPKLQSITSLSTNCGANPCDAAVTGFSITDKVITVSNTAVKQEQCWAEFKDEVIVESYKRGVNMQDLTGTELADVIINRIRDGIRHDLVEKRMFVTPNIYNAYYGSLTTIGTAGSVDYGHSEAQSGINYERLRFRGVELVPVYEWDESFTTLAGVTHPALFTAATAGTDPTQGCIYIAKDNIFIGTDVSSPDNELKMFYDEVGEKMLIRAAFTMGFQYGWNSLVNGGMLV